MQRKYEILECDTCKRRTERLIDPIRPSINKCNITHKCIGILTKRAESSVASGIIDPSQSGVVNWKSRHTVNQQEYDDSKTPVDIISGSGHIAMAIKNPGTQSIKLKFDIQKNDSVDFLEFSYIRSSGTTQVTGPDDTANHNVLRFTGTDTIKVFVNGILMPSNKYDILSLGTIKFSPSLIDEHNSVKIVVYKNVPTSTVLIEFKSICGNLSAWQNIKKIEMYNNSAADEMQIFICDNISHLSLNSKFSISADQPIAYGDWYFLLSRAPHSSYDRDMSRIINIDTLRANKTHLVYEKDVVGISHLTSSTDISNEVFPPLKILEKCTPDTGSKTTDANDNIFNQVFIN